MRDTFNFTGVRLQMQPLQSPLAMPAAATECTPKKHCQRRGDLGYCGDADCIADALAAKRSLQHLRQKLKEVAGCSPGSGDPLRDRRGAASWLLLLHARFFGSIPA